MQIGLKYQVAVIGAGPAGLFAAEKLACLGYSVAIFNRDIKPGGMAEYGIFPDKHTIREGLRKQFKRILGMENIAYYGNATIGSDGCASFEDLRSWGFGALLVACGAQGTKWLGIPGEKLTGVYHAKDLVYYYNRLPPYSKLPVEIGKRVAIIGVGNVAADVAHYLVKYRNVDLIYIIARRGPAEVKFEKRELEPIIRSVDLEDLDSEFGRVGQVMRSLEQDPETEKSFLLSAFEKAGPKLGNGLIRFRFLLSPSGVAGTPDGKVEAILLDENKLALENGEVKARTTGTSRRLEIDTVVFAIGDQVDPSLGLPLERNDVFRSKHPLFSVDGESYEIGDPQTGRTVDGLFVAGWSRKASHGLVGIAKKDGINAACAVDGFLKSKGPGHGISVEALSENISRWCRPVVSRQDLDILEAEENKQAALRGLLEYKFQSNEEMLKVIGT